jgi:hypothetical protein
MQTRNPNIDERLQLLNDYIQRTIDALHMTRQVAQGLTTPGYPIGIPVGLNHSSFVNYPQFVQTPQGMVPVNTFGVPQFQGVPQIPFTQSGNVGFPISGIPGVGGLSHSPYSSSPFGSQMPFSPMSVYGYPQVLPQLTGFNYGITGGLSHTGMVPQFVSPWQIPISQWQNGLSQYGIPGIQQISGLSHGSFVQNPFGIPVSMPQWPVNMFGYGIPQFGGMSHTTMQPQNAVTQSVLQNAAACAI